jgi:hypothetical protein
MKHTTQSATAAGLAAVLVVVGVWFFWGWAGKGCVFVRQGALGIGEKERADRLMDRRKNKQQTKNKTNKTKRTDNGQNVDGRVDAPLDAVAAGRAPLRLEVGRLDPERPQRDGKRPADVDGGAVDEEQERAVVALLFCFVWGGG